MQPAVVVVEQAVPVLEARSKQAALVVPEQFGHILALLIIMQVVDQVV
jgi:hypothetical protein